MSITWFGELPKWWESRTIKSLFHIQKDIAGTEDYDVLSITQRGIKIKDIESNQGQMAQSYAKYQLVNIGDFAMNHMDLLTGWVDCAKVSGVTSPDYRVFVLDDKTQNKEYLLRVLQLCYTQRIFYALGRGAASEGRWRLPRKEFMNFLIPLPPREEQDQIVRYLDWKVSQINKLINAKRRQIKLLQEQKQAVINLALNKGENEWEDKPLKHWVKSNQISLSSNTNHDYELNYLDISSIGHGFIKQAPVHLTFAEAPSRARRVVQYGDTIISTVRTYLRSVCFVNHDIEHCIVSTGFSVLTPNKDTVLPELLSFVLSADAFIDTVIKNSIGVSYPAINDSVLMRLKVSLPQSLREQKCLYLKIKEQFNLFDIVIQKIQQQVSAFLEYRTRLISDVITGEIDVRGVEVPKYESVEETPDDTMTNEKENDETED